MASACDRERDQTCVSRAGIPPKRQAERYIERYVHDPADPVARALKITIPLDAAEVRALPDPGGQARSQLAIACEGKVYTADIATKALRKAKGVIGANGAENVFVMVQGKLKGNEIIDCGLVAQVKTPKPSVEAVEAVGA